MKQHNFQDRVGNDLNKLREDLTETGRALWLAGLGAVAEVEREGRGLFDEMVEKGRKVEKAQFKAIDRTLAETSKRVKTLSDRVQHRVEGGFKDTLHRFGLATGDDLKALAGRLDALSKKVDGVSAGR